MLPLTVPRLCMDGKMEQRGTALLNQTSCDTRIQQDIGGVIANQVQLK